MYHFMIEADIPEKHFTDIFHFSTTIKQHVLAPLFYKLNHYDIYSAYNNLSNLASSNHLKSLLHIPGKIFEDKERILELFIFVENVFSLFRDIIFALIGSVLALISLVLILKIGFFLLSFGRHKDDYNKLKNILVKLTKTSFFTSFKKKLVENLDFEKINLAEYMKLIGAAFIFLLLLKPITDVTGMFQKNTESHDAVLKAFKTMSPALQKRILVNFPEILAEKKPGAYLPTGSSENIDASGFTEVLKRVEEINRKLAEKPDTVDMDSRIDIIKNNINSGFENNKRDLAQKPNSYDLVNIVENTITHSTPKSGNPIQNNYNNCPIQKGETQMSSSVQTEIKDLSSKVSGINLNLGKVLYKLDDLNIKLDNEYSKEKLLREEYPTKKWLKDYYSNIFGPIPLASNTTKPKDILSRISHPNITGTNEKLKVLQYRASQEPPGH
jgi:hypothetical protein